MTLPYFLKLVCLSSAAFFLIHAGLGLAVYASSPWALKVAERLRPRTAARLLLTLRLLPVSAALFVVLGMCVPAYLSHEPEETAERVGVFCILLALLGAALWLQSFFRSLHALAGSAQYQRRFRGTAREDRFAAEPWPLLVVETQAPFVVLAGVIRSRVVISRPVLQALSAEELDVALGHEGAHLACHDNLKRLLFLLTPEIVPFTRGFAALERAWRKFSEWAADDEATQCDANRSLVLASALVRLARMGSPAPTPALAASLLAADENLARRVERLLHAQPAPNPPRPFTHNLLRGATLMMAGSLAVGLLLTDVSLVVVHGLLEQLIR